MKNFSFTVILLFSLQSYGQKYCFSGTGEEGKGQFIESVNNGTQMGVIGKNKTQKKKQITVHAKNAGNGVQFVSSSVSNGDCFLLDPVEEITLGINETPFPPVKQKAWGRFQYAFKNIFKKEVFKDEALYPAVRIASSDGAKHFGYLKKDFFSQLKKESHPEISVEDLLNHSTAGQSELTLIYVICPQDRNEWCDLTIKHHGAWVTDDTDEKFSLKVLARSRRETKDGDASYRLFEGGDTPEGIYLLWASMYTERKVFGRSPRIDIDAALAPLNIDLYPKNSFLLSQILPAEHFLDYWVNEYPLAYSLGRVFLRIHGNSIDPEKPSLYTVPSTGEKIRPTAGCVNLGSQMDTFLNKLIELGVFQKGDLVKEEDANRPLGWKVAPSLGEVVLVVRDR